MQLNLTASKDGYVQIFVASESEVDTWFDDLEITFKPSLIAQETHYDPWGLELLGIEKLGKPENQFKYNGKELQSDLSLNWYDYGARFYDPQLGRFTIQDRFADKYLSLTPYQYGANNPIKFIDVNGDSLWIIHQNNQILYNQGKLTNKDGSDYRGEGVKMQKDGSIKLTGFLKNAVKGLEEIRTGGDAGNELISNIENNDRNVFIRKGTANTTKGLVVDWNPSNTEGGLDVNGNRTTPSFVSLAHELGHAWDWAADKKVDAQEWFKMSDGRSIPNAEKYGSHWENRIRADHKLPLREYYGIDKGKGVGRLLIPSTRLSPNYFMQIGPVILPYSYKK